MPSKKITVKDAYRTAKRQGGTSAAAFRKADERSMRNFNVKVNAKQIKDIKAKAGKKPSGDRPGPWDNIGRGLKTAGKVTASVAKGTIKDSIKTVMNPVGAAKDLIKGTGSDVKNKRYKALGLTALSMVPIPSAKGAGKTLSEIAEQAAKAGSVTKKTAAAAKKAAAAEKAAAKVKPTVKKKDIYKKGVNEKLTPAETKKVQEFLNSDKTKYAPKKKTDVQTTVNMTKFKSPKNLETSPATRQEFLSNKYGLGKETVKPSTLAKDVRPKSDSTPKVTNKPAPKKKPAPAEKVMPKADVPKVTSAQAELATARKNMQAFKAKHGPKYRSQKGFKELQSKIASKEMKVSNATKVGAPKNPRGVTQKTMTNTVPAKGDAQRTYGGVGRSNTNRAGVTGAPKPDKGQFEGDLLKGQARNDAANMSNKGLNAQKRAATLAGRRTENVAANAANIKVRELDRKMAKFKELRDAAVKSKKPKDVLRANKFAQFWGLKVGKPLK